MSASRVLSIADIKAEPAKTDVRRLRLTLQSSDEALWRDTVKRKPVGRAYAVMSSKGSGDFAWDVATGETLKTRSLYEPDIKGMVVPEAQPSQEASLRQLRTELQHFKEVRHSMENIREQLYCRMNGVRRDVADYHGLPDTDRGDDETEKMREATRHLYSKLQEAERRHESKRKVLEDQAGHHQKQLGEARESLQRSEERVAERDKRIEELQRLMTGMEKEHQILATKMRENECQLEEMRVQNQAGMADHHRSLQLEKEVETLREKICHLNDMLKSQQRKVRQMIEQIQTSRSQIEEKDVLIQQLQERVEHLESENREMQDHLEYVTRGEGRTQQGSLTSRGQGLTDHQISHSSRLPLGSKKPRALVRVLETS
ncbi:tuftelin-like isoform X1 [Carcharodon carcharias]|uniref:tuftelin-like isoform X1 n=1 Tax=Carcharodon carcharias TaxID=13397 RepID=UPI001B7F162A|nr:tuftelin-like isoform X1 [Carcharodon carcharias]